LKWAAGSSFCKRPYGCRHGSRFYQLVHDEIQRTGLNDVDHLFGDYDGVAATAALGATVANRPTDASRLIIENTLN
jgi:hypothetical protein